MTASVVVGCLQQFMILVCQKQRQWKLDVVSAAEYLNRKAHGECCHSDSHVVNLSEQTDLLIA